MNKAKMMRQITNQLFIALIFIGAQAVFPLALKAENPEVRRVHHDLMVELDPVAQHFTAKDTVTLSEGHPSEFQFLLHEGLTPVTTSQEVRITRQSGQLKSSFLELFNIKLPPGQRTFVLSYGGRIHHSLKDYGKVYARGIKQTLGIISEEGVYLSGSSYWYPHINEDLITFNLQVKLPADWNAVSQGQRAFHDLKKQTRHVRWESPQPQEEIYLVAARFTEYTKPVGRVAAMVFLRTADEVLANKYLAATGQYVAMYEKLIGPYPYQKFALVENFWETGFGMPSFTLLGPKVIRFPFILHSSYPHEILHNWWGNSVFPESGKGNWTEGLTAYLADHLIKEQRGHGSAYRQAALQKYTDYVSQTKDFPLAKFKARHSSSTEAVGYGKSLMFFHMLRLGLSDEVFVRGLQDFYDQNRFRFASFDTLQSSFENVSGKNLEKEFNQWINQPGAPQLKIGAAAARSEKSGYLLTAFLEQIQPGQAYQLRIPVAVTLEGQPRAHQILVNMKAKRLELKIRVPARPLRIDVDPEFDLFRKLDRNEIPPALTQAFGAKEVLILLPESSAGEARLRSYRALARSWSQSGPEEVEVKLDSEIDRLPADRAIVIFGWNNRFLEEMIFALDGYDVKINRKTVRIGTAEIPRQNHCVVLTARHPKNKELALTWVAVDPEQAVTGLGRKLPHYHKYSYLAFKESEPVNILKGRWPVLNSPMTQFVRHHDGTISRVKMAKLTSRDALATLPSIFSSNRMMEIIRYP